MIEVVNRTVGGEYCNSYIVGNEGEDCFLVDFGYDKNGFITSYALAHHPKILGVLLTHGHYDHIYGFKEGLPSYPVFLSEEDHIFLTDPHYNGSIELFDDPLTIDGLLPYPVEDEDEIKLGNFFVKVIATPFHTGGSVCFYLEKEDILFSGDTLFSHGIGRYDLKGACPRFLESSLQKLMKLPEETVVYPGHGRKTTIGEEKRFLFQ